MRIVQLITQSRGGPVDHAVDVAIELDRLGHEVHLIGPGADYAARIVATGVTFHRAEIASKMDLTGARSVSSLVARLQPDVVHCQDRRAGLIGRIIALRHNISSVYTLHGVPDSLAHRVQGNLRFMPQNVRVVVANRWGERLLARTPQSVVVTPCNALQRYAHEYVGIPDTKLFTVHNGISPAWGGPKRRQDRELDALTTAAWLGVMQPVKRVPELVRAIADVSDVRLLLIGDGPERPIVELAIRSSHVSDRVELAGFQPEPAAWLDQADIFVLPSAAEACPMALLQAMIRGIPVVASRVGGIGEIVRHGLDGLLVDAGDDDALREAVARLSKDEKLRTEMGAHARQQVLEHFSLTQCVQRLVDIYEQARS